MLIKIALSVVVLGLSSHACLAQTHKPLPVAVPPRTAPLDISPWLFPVQNRGGDPTLFTPWTTPAQAWDPINANWDFTALTLRISGIQPGLPVNRALLWLRTLGGIEDGGVQSIPATRYFFSPGIMVYVPTKDGYVTGPPQITRESFHTD